MDIVTGYALLSVAPATVGRGGGIDRLSLVHMFACNPLYPLKRGLAPISPEVDSHLYLTWVL